MDVRDSRRFAEEVLERALARYGIAEARPGLEQRVLARLEAERGPAPWRFVPRRLAAGLAIAGIVIAFVVVVHRLQETPSAPGEITRHTVERPERPGSIVRANSPDQTTSPAAPEVSARRGGALAMSHPARLRGNIPRAATFPTPAPLSDEEKVLVSYAQLARAQGLPAYGFDERHETDRIEIAPLVIEPMKIDSPWEGTTD